MLKQIRIKGKIEFEIDMDFFFGQSVPQGSDPVINAIVIHPEGRNNIIGLVADIVGGTAPFTYLWTDLEGDSLFITGTGGSLPASATSGDSNTSTEEIGWHSSTTITTATDPFAVRLTITDAQGKQATVDFEVSDTNPNNVVFSRAETVDYAEEKVYTLPSNENYTYAWTLPESARLVSGTLASSQITIAWDKKVWLEEKQEDLVCVVTADPANPQAVYSTVTIQTTIQGVITGIRAEWGFDDPDHVADAAGVVTQVDDRKGTYHLTPPASWNTATWDGSKVTFPGAGALINAAWNYDPDQVTMVVVCNPADNSESRQVMLHKHSINNHPKIGIKINASDQGQIDFSAADGNPNAFVLQNTFPGNVDLQVLVGVFDIDDFQQIIRNGTDSQFNVFNFSPTDSMLADQITFGNFVFSGSYTTTQDFTGDIYYACVIDGRATDEEIAAISTRLKNHYSIS